MSDELRDQRITIRLTQGEVDLFKEQMAIDRRTMGEVIRMAAIRDIHRRREEADEVGGPRRNWRNEAAKRAARKKRVAE